MSIDASFVRAIEHPESRILREALESASDRTADRLETMGIETPEEWLVRKLAMAYFHDWQTDDPRYVFLLPDPGNLGKRFREAVDSFRARGPDQSAREQVSFYRHLATEWLVEKNTDFSERFFTTLAARGLIDLADGWRSYIRDGAFFDDFYMTDVMKYRTGGYNTSEGRAAYRNQLRQELEAIAPELVFTFGGPVWGTAKQHLGAEPVETTDVNRSSIMAMHGHLCRTQEHVETWLLPLSHMSGQVWWRFPPDEYVDRLDTGVERWLARK